MTTEQTLALIAISGIIAGLIAPILIKWIIKKQNGWRFKLIKDNGRYDIIDEFNYWYKRLARERKSLEEAVSNPEAEDIGEDVTKVLSDRLEILNKFMASRISGDKKLDLEAADQLSSLIEDRQEFMDSTRKAFIASRPDFMRYLESKGLTTREINYCCLYLIGLRAKEIGNYLGLRSHYNTSCSIRTKLGLESNTTNLGIYLRKLMRDFTSPNTCKTDKVAEAEYTPRQLRGALLCEILFDYLGILIVACDYTYGNELIESAVLMTALIMIVLAVRVLILYRNDILPVIKLTYSMNELSLLPLIGTIWILLLFATPFVPEAFYPYIGYPSFIASQLLLLYGIYRYSR